ncbi:MAG: aconitase X catalytic domain-containing protein [Acidimicrobiia bacterium]
MNLSERDQAMLNGDLGSGVELAMRLLVEVGTAQGGHDLIDITSAHIDGCLYHGRAGVDFARELADGGSRVAVPTTLNVSSLDLLHPELYRGSAESASASKIQMDAYVSMGCQPTWTCSPYQLAHRPGLGDQIAWGESNAIVFANSVLGARTERYGDFMDICCALTGRAPNVGLHTTDGRRARMVVDLNFDDGLLDEELTYPLIGGAIGKWAGNRVVAIVGLDARASEDRLKALGAAAASTGAVAMFHAVGVTPESATLEDATQGINPDRRVAVGASELAEAFDVFNQSAGTLGAVTVGTPHFSLSEFLALHEMIGHRRTKVPFYVNTGREVLTEIVKLGLTDRIEEFGATIVTDTCAYITPIIGDVDGVVMTNSGKAAFYAPGNLGVQVAFGSLRDCVESAETGRVVSTGPFA